MPTNPLSSTDPLVIVRLLAEPAIVIVNGLLALTPFLSLT